MAKEISFKVGTFDPLEKYFRDFLDNLDGRFIKKAEIVLDDNGDRIVTLTLVERVFFPEDIYTLIGPNANVIK